LHSLFPFLHFGNGDLSIFAPGIGIGCDDILPLDGVTGDKLGLVGVILTGIGNLGTTSPLMVYEDCCSISNHSLYMDVFTI